MKVELLQQKKNPQGEKKAKSRWRVRTGRNLLDTLLELGLEGRKPYFLKKKKWKDAPGSR